jgi:hypothetical protein
MSGVPPAPKPNDAHRPGRIIERRCDARRCWQRGCPRCKMQKSSAGKFRHACPHGWRFQSASSDWQGMSRLGNPICNKSACKLIRKHDDLHLLDWRQKSRPTWNRITNRQESPHQITIELKSLRRFKASPVAFRLPFDDADSALDYEPAGGLVLDRDCAGRAVNHPRC